MYLRTEGRLAGCWVMPIQEDLESTPKAQLPTPKPTPERRDSSRRTEDDEEREKVIVRSNGVVTYVGKDIAYQFWKLGLLGPRLPLPRVRRRGRNGPLWATCTHRRRSATIRCSAARRTSTTSSTSGSRICRSC